MSRRRGIAVSPLGSSSGAFLRAFLVVFALLVVTGELWSLSTPINEGPDEVQHLTKAAAVVRGEWVGSSAHESAASTRVSVPAVYTGSGVGNCDSAHPGSCFGRTGSSRTVSADTYVGHYPPLYYLLVGWPTAFANRMSIYLMRAMSVVVNAVFLALAAAVALTWSRSRLMIPALALAITPTVVFLSGVVNPNGLEISAAIAMWTAAVVLVVDHPRRPPRGLVAVLGAAVTVELLVRGDSMLWPVLCVVVLLPLAWGRLDWRSLAGRPDVRVTAGLIVLAAAGGLVWLLLVNPLSVVPLQVPRPGTPASTLAGQIVASGPEVLNQAIGVFGYAGVRAPALTYVIWYCLLGVMIAIALLVGGRRARWSLSLAVLLSLGVPFVMTYIAIRHTGPIQQGRYFLPLAVSVPLVCGAVSAPDGRTPATVVRFALAVPVFAAAAQVGAAYWALRQYSLGIPWAISLFARVRVVWHPPVPAWILALGFLCVWTTLAALAVMAVCSRRGVADSDDRTTGVATADLSLRAEERVR